jgi:hypothetical protein
MILNSSLVFIDSDHFIFDEETLPCCLVKTQQDIIMVTNFQSLISAARQQSQPQRLLFLFAKAETEKEGKSDTQRGTLSPLMCVDKLPEELTTFAEFSDEADSISPDWDFMLAAGLSGNNGKPPSSEDAEAFLNQMVDNLTSGQDLSRYVIFDRNDNPVLIQAG